MEQKALLVDYVISVRDEILNLEKVTGMDGRSILGALIEGFAICKGVEIADLYEDLMAVTILAHSNIPELMKANELVNINDLMEEFN